MDTPDHNNSKPASSFGRARPDIETLGDLIEFVAGQRDIAPSKKRFVLSALRRARALLAMGKPMSKQSPSPCSSSSTGSPPQWRE